MSNKDLYQKWIEAQNTDISLLNEIAHNECIVHQARIDDKDSKRYIGPEALIDVISSGTYFLKIIKCHQLLVQLKKEIMFLLVKNSQESIIEKWTV